VEDEAMIIKETQKGFLMTSTKDSHNLAKGNMSKKSQFWEVILSKLSPHDLSILGMCSPLEIKYLDKKQAFCVNLPGPGCHTVFRDNHSVYEDITFREGDIISFYYNVQNLKLYVFHERKLFHIEQLPNLEWRPAFYIFGKNTEFTLVKEGISFEILQLINSIV
jgi:hypothetical protein